MSSEMDELIIKLKKNPLLKNITITDRNLADVCFYLNEITNCKNCKGLEDCKNSLVGMTPFYDGNNLSNKKCRYLQLESLRNKVNHYFASNYLSEATLADFHLTTDSRNKSYLYIQSILANPKKMEKGLYIYGNFGSGKTYFLSALANELATKNIESIIVFMPDLSRNLKNAMNDYSLEKKIDALKNTPYLMFDDLGGEMMTSWLRDEVIAPIIQYRMVNELPIYISSNLDYVGLREHFSQTKDDLDNLKANRILERIKIMTKRVIFEKQ